MDPHFNEYLAAIAGMSEVYGERPESQPSEFHGDDAGRRVEEHASIVAAA